MIINEAVTWYQTPSSFSYQCDGGEVALGIEDNKFCLEGYGWKAFLFIENYADRNLPEQILNSFLGYKEMHVYYGPIQTEADADLGAWIRALENMARLFNVSKIKVIPSYCSYIDNDCCRDSLELPFKEKGYELIPYHSPVLDLRASEEELWKSLKSEARRKVRRTSEGGVVVKKIDDFEDLQKWFLIKDRNTPYHHNRIKKILNDSSGRAEYYAAFMDGEPLAWQGILWGNDVALLESNASSYNKKYKKIFANHLLQWEIIKLAKQKDMKWLDWVGAEPESADSKMQNIMKFKLNWGGQLVAYNYFVKEVRPCSVKLVKTLLAIRSNIIARRK